MGRVISANEPSFGLLHYGRILGMVFGGVAIGIICGPPAAGMIFDKTGSHHTAFMLFLAAFLAISVLALTVQRRHPRRRFQHDLDENETPRFTHPQ